MNDLLTTLLDALKKSSAASKVTLGLVAVAIVAAVGVTGMVASKPHYGLLLSQLDASESAKVGKALSDAGIAFSVSQPPGPFSVFVDEADRTAALAAAYGDGALERPMKGIVGTSGMESVFLGARERNQITEKRVWQEMEAMLEEFDFIVSARVQASGGDGSALPGDETAKTCSVHLRTQGGLPVEQAQGRTIARMVSSGLGVDPKLLMISDHLGRTIHDGASEKEGETIQDFLDHKERYDRVTEEKANGVLATILGANKARVTVSSEWSFDKVTTNAQTTGKGTVVSETSNSTETPFKGSQDRPTGIASNLADEDGEAATDAGTAAAPLLSTTDESTKEYQPSITTATTVNVAPQLNRMSVALFLDAGLSEQEASLVEAVKAAVGFDTQRKDVFTTATLPFYVPEVIDPEGGEGTAEGAPGEPVAEESGSNPMMENLMRRGVEIVTAVVFLLVLLKTLKSSKVDPTVAEDGPEEEIDPELLAQAQVQELLTESPERVGEILSAWAREEQKAGAAK